MAQTYDPNGAVLTSAVERSGAMQTLVQTSYNTRGLFQCLASRDPAYASSLPAGACTVTSSTLAGADQIKQVGYDAAGHATLSFEGVGTSDAATVATYAYGADGEKSSATDANGYLTTFLYDGFNRLVTVEFPSPTVTGQSQTASAGIEGYAYDANSNLTTLTRRGGAQLTYGFDNLNRNTSASETVTTGYSNYAFGYDNFSRLTSMSTTPGSGAGAQTYSFAYDQLGRKTGETAPVGTATSTWDTAGRRTRLTWPDGFYVGYGYDTVGELTSVQDSTGVTLATLAYDNLGQRTSLSRNSGVVTSYGYDAASRLASIAHSLPSGQSQTESYAYNVASQVQTKTGSNDGWAWNGGYNFNRSYGVDGLNEQTSAGANTLTYGSKGVLTGDGTLTYSYDTNNTLFQASNGSTQQYDAAGRLYSVGSSGATRFLYDGSMAIAEYNSSGWVNRRFVPGIGVDEPLVWYEGAGTSTRYGLTTDRMGSVTGITTDAGALSAVNSYDEYGIPGSSNAGRYQYTGQKYLSEYGMYDYKARVYSPTLGRFIQPDPIGYGDGINFYQYTYSSPVNGSDPSGMDGTDDYIPDKTDDGLVLPSDGGTFVTPLCWGGSGAGNVPACFTNISQLTTPNVGSINRGQGPSGSDSGGGPQSKTACTNTNPKTGAPLAQPPGVSLQTNAAIGAAVGLLPFPIREGAMAALFLPNGLMDYQRSFRSNGLVNRNYVDFGNYNFGVVAAYAGYPLPVALAGAGAANPLGTGVKTGPFGSNPNNNIEIKAGYNAAVKGKLCP